MNDYEETACIIMRRILTMTPENHQTEVGNYLAELIDLGVAASENPVASKIHADQVVARERGQ